MTTKQEIEHIDEKMELIYEDVKYLRNKVDSLVWRMVALGTVSGAVSAGITTILLLSRSI